MKVKAGDKIYMPNETTPYEVQARDDRYIICTQPCAEENSVFYFIIDLLEKWRAPDNMIFCSGYETQEDCLERLKELQSGEIELSVRRGLPLDIDVE